MNYIRWRFQLGFQKRQLKNTTKGIELMTNDKKSHLKLQLALFSVKKRFS